MPILNEILAPFYTEVLYRTSVQRIHRLRLFWETGSLLQAPLIGDANDLVLTGPSTGTTTSISGIVSEIFERASFEGALTPSPVIDQILNWQSSPGANVFINANTVPIVPSAGGAAANASAYHMYVAQASNRKKARFTFFDAGSASPQRSSVVVPVTDDGKLPWYILRGSIGFATNDGFRLSSVLSLNVGYNRKLARTYGRGIAP